MVWMDQADVYQGNTMLHTSTDSVTPKSTEHTRVSTYAQLPTWPQH
jgi:hypothetical protein